MENVKKQVGDIHKVTCYADKELASAYRSVEGRMDEASANHGQLAAAELLQGPRYARGAAGASCVCACSFAAAA